MPLTRDQIHKLRTAISSGALEELCTLALRQLDAEAAFKEPRPPYCAVEGTISFLRPGHFTCMICRSEWPYSAVTCPHCSSMFVPNYY